MKLADDIRQFLEGCGFECSVQMRSDFDVLCTATHCGRHDRTILPIEISATSPQEAEHQAEEAYEAVRLINSCDGEYPLIVTQDRWCRQREMMEKRILAHLEVFSPIYARNCEVRRIDKALAREFLDRTHSYGYAACRYCYGMFLKRHTGHIAAERDFADARNDGGNIVPGTLVAVATFSNARKWVKGDRTVRSYEWTRYASLPEVRISGGMGRMLKHFIKEVGPDDIMTYADLEWSKGDAYMQLGFMPDSYKAPVMFTVDENLQRFPIKSGMTANLYFRNFGSNKFRLKLTDYE